MVGQVTANFLIEALVIVEIKTVSRLTKIHG
jgi:hypothetical protein